MSDRLMKSAAVALWLIAGNLTVLTLSSLSSPAVAQHASRFDQAIAADFRRALDCAPNDDVCFVRTKVAR